MDIGEYEAQQRARIERNLSYTDQGVVFIDAGTVYIDEGVRIGAGTVIYPCVVIEGDVEIGENCVIGQNTRIKDSSIGDDTTVQSSVILESRVGSGTSVGPFAYLRPGSDIGDGCKVGDFVEVKNSRMGDGSKAAHLTYIGDSDVGERVNLGCGVVFVNYDGSKKYRSVVEDDAFNALFMLNAPDLSQYESRLQCELGNGYVLYKMDDATWLGRMATHGGAHAGEKYMWSLYRLTPIADLGSLSSSGSKSPFLALEPKAGRYALEDGSAWLDLNADGTFVFAVHSGENHQPSGAWEYEDGSLVLYAGEDTYRFTVALDGETLYFATESGTEKGKAFRYCGNTTQLLQWKKEMYPSEDGVAGFLTLAAEHGISTGYEGDACYNVTPAWIAEATDDYAIFKYNRSCASYLSYDSAVYPLGMWFGGFGFTDAALADLDGDGRNELYFTCSYGSGMHWAQAGYFDPVSKEVKLFSFSYPLDGVEGCSELALRVQEDGIGVYAAQIACSKGETQFVELSLAPQEELGSISCLDGVIAFFEKDGTWHTAEGMGKEAS